MDLASSLALIRRHGELLASTPTDGLDAIVPSCPDWTVAQLIGHTGWVHRWATANLLAPPGMTPDRGAIERAPTGPSVLSWYRDALEELLDTFEHVELDREFNTFTGPQQGRWWVRRMVHETAMHRWDGQAALGTPEPFDPALAADGIDEALDSYASRRFDHEKFGSSGQSLHLHATDTEQAGEEIAGEWMLYMHPNALTWSHEHGKGDAAVRGAASDLLLFVMSRRRSDELDVFGDAELPSRWQAAATF